jgi:hypothetical protein
LKTVAKPGISGANGPAPPKTTVGAANAYSSTPPRRHVLDLGMPQGPCRSDHAEENTAHRPCTTALHVRWGFRFFLCDNPLSHCSLASRIATCRRPPLLTRLQDSRTRLAAACLGSRAVDGQMQFPVRVERMRSPRRRRTTAVLRLPAVSGWTVEQLSNACAGRCRDHGDCDRGDYGAFAHGPHSDAALRTGTQFIASLLLDSLRGR